MGLWVWKKLQSNPMVVTIMWKLGGGKQKNDFFPLKMIFFLFIAMSDIKMEDDDTTSFYFLQK